MIESSSLLFETFFIDRAPNADEVELKLKKF